MENILNTSPYVKNQFPMNYYNSLQNSILELYSTESIEYCFNGSTTPRVYYYNSTRDATKWKIY